MLAPNAGKPWRSRRQVRTCGVRLASILAPKLSVKLPGQDSWQKFAAGASFEVAANQKFQLQVAHDTAYLCTYG